MKRIVPLLKMAWNRFTEYYRKSHPEPSDGTGNTRTIYGERQTVHYLAMFLQEELSSCGLPYTVHEEFPMANDRIRLDLAVIDPQDWRDLRHADADERKVLLGIELKYLLGGTHKNYNWEALEKDCAKLTGPLLGGRLRESSICFIIRRRNWVPEDIGAMEKKYPAVSFFSCHCPPLLVEGGTAVPPISRPPR